jgi:hypothetical protein
MKKKKRLLNFREKIPQYNSYYVQNDHSKATKDYKMETDWNNYVIAFQTQCHNFG